MRHFHICAVVVLIGSLLPVGSADADTISFSDSIPLTLTNWSDTVSIQKFDPSLGILLDVEFTLAENFVGSMCFENMDENNPSPFTLRLSWLVALQRPDSSDLVTIDSLREESGVVAPFDGLLDFGGPSGVTFDIDEAETATGSAMPGDLALFTGVGTIELPVVATAESFVSGGSPAASYFSAAAAADVTVTYVYIPEPASLSMLAFGGLALRRRRRRR